MPMNSIQQDPTDTGSTVFYDHFDVSECVYKSDLYGPPIVSSYIIKTTLSEGEILFNYPKKNASYRKWKTSDLKFSDARFMYSDERNVDEELESCQHLIPELALGACKPTSLADFVYFILPTCSGNLLYGISYVARFVNEKPDEGCTEPVVTEAVEVERVDNEHCEAKPGTAGKKKMPTAEDMDEVIGKDEKEEPEDDGDYYFVSICLISSVPFFGVIGSRLECVAQTYFSTGEFLDYALLSSFVDQINSEVSVDTLPYDSLYFNLETYFKPSILSLSSRGMIFMLKCILSEQKIAIYSESAARTTTCILSLLTMIPGANSLNFNSKGFGVMWHEWKMYGMPLRLFHSKNVLLPYFKHFMLDLIKDCRGYIIGITDLGILADMENPPEILFDLEDELVKLRSRKMFGLYTPSFYEISLFDEFECLEESDDDPFRMVEESGEALFSTISDYLTKAPSTMVDIGSKAVRMCSLKSRSKGQSKKKESMLKLFDMYFPGALPTFLGSRIRKSSSVSEVHVQYNIPEMKRSPKPFTFGNAFSTMYRKFNKKKYRYFGYMNALQNNRYQPDRNLEIEYAHNTRIHPIQDYLLKFLKAAAYVGGNNRLIHQMVMEFSLELDSLVDYSIPVTGGVIRRDGSYFRCEVPINFNDSSDDDSDNCVSHTKDNTAPATTPKNKYGLKENEELVKFTVPSMLAASILEIQHDYSIEFVELWIQTLNAKSFFMEHKLELFNEPIFFLNSDLAKYKYPNGDIYIGQLSDMLRNGRGTYISNDGSRYDGEWRSDKRHGKGTLHYKDGTYKYSGEWYLDRKHGKGHLKTSEFEYIGEFQHNKFHGRGVLTNKDGSILEGTFKSGKFHGQGMLTLPDGSVQMGTFKNNEIVGICSLVGKDGRAYVGKLHGNLPDGNGSLKYDSHVSFEGFWVKGVRSRQGIITLSVSDVEKVTIEGIWDNDEMLMDDALITFPSGSKYNGGIAHFTDFQRCSINAIIEKDCDFIEAKDAFDSIPNHILPNGHGVCKSPNGTIYNGNFICGMRFGNGTIVFPNGAIYVGTWYFGRFHGEGTLNFSDKNVETIKFDRGKLVTDVCSEHARVIKEYISHEGTLFEHEFTKFNLDPILKAIKKT